MLKLGHFDMYVIMYQRKECPLITGTGRFVGHPVILEVETGCPTIRHAGKVNIL